MILYLANIIWWNIYTIYHHTTADLNKTWLTFHITQSRLVATVRFYKTLKMGRLRLILASLQITKKSFQKEGRSDKKRRWLSHIHLQNSSSDDGSITLPEITPQCGSQIWENILKRMDCSWIDFPVMLLKKSKRPYNRQRLDNEHNVKWALENKDTN